MGKKISKGIIAVVRNRDFVPSVPDDSLPDPRRIVFEAWYLSYESPTFGNALRSAVKAGFTDNYAKNILHVKPQWLRDIVGKFDRQSFVRKASANLKEDLNINPNEQIITSMGPLIDKEGKPLTHLNPQLVEKRQKATLWALDNIENDLVKPKEKGMGSGEAIGVQFNFYTPQEGKKPEQPRQEPMEAVIEVEVPNQVETHNEIDDLIKETINEHTN